MKKNISLIAFLAIIAAAAAVGVSILASEDSRACRAINGEVSLCVASDMAKLPDHGSVPLEHESLAIADGPLKLNAARNETIAFQLLIKSRGLKQSAKLHLTIEEPSSREHMRISARGIQQFQAWYHFVDIGGYSWGPESDVLAWPEYYPDALIPQLAPCSAKSEPLYQSLSIPENKSGLQSTWVDMYIPSGQAPGIYTGRIVATLDTGEQLAIPVEIRVWPATLPDKPTFDAVGEVYMAYLQEGASMDRAHPRWKTLAHCYQKLAHQHRMTFIERSPVAVDGSDWSTYDAIYSSILDGSLFSSDTGYIGPGADTPVSVWRTPWPQAFDVELQNPLSEQQLNQYTEWANNWMAHAKTKGWTQTDFFAYIFDEIDGPAESGIDTVKRRQYLAMAHNAMAYVQDAIDRGAGPGNIDLIWTSHSDPSIWHGDGELDLTGTIRWWVPNAKAANPGFFAERKKHNEKIWFYHSGHPYVGVHSINASGIEMRTWGVIGARYGFDGQFMWAINLGSDTQPYARPSYKDEDDRFGNGVLVYPGNALDKIGYAKTTGPIPSMRLKAWRRGLQDAELAVLAKKAGSEGEVQQLLESIIPVALGSADGKAKWPKSADTWIDFHISLLKLASGHGDTVAARAK